MAGVFATMIADLAMSGLETEIEGEEARLGGRHKGGALKRLRLSRPQHLQRLVLGAAVLFFNALIESAQGAEQRRGLHVSYLALLIEHALGHGSFEGNVAVNGFLYGCSASEVLLFQDFVTEGGHKRSDSHVGKRRQAILSMLEENLGQWVRRQQGRSGQLRLVPDEGVGTEPIAAVLAALVPWDGRCVLPPGFGSKKRLPRSRWPRIGDLHSPAAPSSRDEDRRYEVNRLYAMVEPSVRALLAAMLGIAGNPQVPRLFLAGEDTDLEERHE
ncbi:MAG TPA: hypothetical protein VGE98_02395 [Thermoanaerobaculia bacterium]